MVEEKNFAFSVGPESLKESNLALLKPRFHKSGLELLLSKNVFTSEIADIVDGHLSKMKIILAKRKSPAKKRKTGVQTNLETTFNKATKTSSDSGSNDCDDNDSDSSENELD